jgi:transposase
MGRREFEMYEYRQILVRLRLGESIRSVAASGVASRGKVRSIHKIALQQNWLDPAVALPGDEVLSCHFGALSSTGSNNTQSSVLPWQEQVTQWCRQGIQASTIHATLTRAHGFTGSYDSVQRFVKKIKEQTPLKATTILDFKPGESAQVDFGSGPKFIDPCSDKPVSSWFFVMVLSWSRHQYTELVFHQNVETWLGCHRRAFEWFHGVPKKIIIDNAKCAITRACYYDPVVQRAYADFAEGYGFMISACPPYDAPKKGRVESGVKYVKKNFMPLRDFRNLLTEANRQLRAWVLETAGNRIHGTTHEKPLVLFESERLFLKPLPENPPELAVWQKVKLHGDCHVTYLKCRYSAPCQLIHQVLWLRASETSVRLYQDSTLVATHPRLSGVGKRHTCNEHLPPNAVAFAMRDAGWCLAQAKKTGSACHDLVSTLLNDSVVDYLRAAQGIIGLQKKYGAARLEAACARAIAFQCLHYKAVKSILASGVEYAPLPEQEAFDVLAETYTGQGRFCRDVSKLIQ